MAYAGRVLARSSEFILPWACYYWHYRRLSWPVSSVSGAALVLSDCSFSGVTDISLPTATNNPTVGPESDQVPARDEDKEQ
jgi:hypothetical protein